MRILQIQLKNLNSLRGEHGVDLTSEPLASAGLFAITGATGAGKTTLLDAVTLALYGRAARYGNEANPEDMMSRHTAECRAEVVFEISTGVYRACWEMRRARGNPNGKLQPPNRYIYNHDDGTVLAEQIREADQCIVKLIKLDYERFMRSVLLAQGEFSKFLKSKPGERADLLEQLTGTQLYSRISVLAYNEARDRETELDLKSANLDALEILDDDELAKTENRYATGTRRQANQKKKLDQDEKTVAKIDTLKTQRDREKAAKEDLVRLKDEKKNAKENLKRLERHRQTNPFVSILTNLDTATETHVEAIKTIEAEKENLAAAREQLNAAQHAFQSALQLSVKTESENKSAAKDASGDAKKRLEAAKMWLSKNKKDKKLGVDIVGISASLGDLKHTRASAKTHLRDWAIATRSASQKAAKDLPKKVEELLPAELKKVVKICLKKLQQETDESAKGLEEASEELRNRRDHRDMARDLAKIESHRVILSQGKPCPLCGASEHPHAHRKIKNRDIEKLESSVEDAEMIRDEFRDQKQTLSQAYKSLNNQSKTVLDAVSAKVDATQEIALTLEPFGVEVPASNSEEALRKKLKKRADAYQKNADAMIKAKNDQTLAQQQLIAANTRLKELKAKVGKLKPLPKGAKVKPLKPGGIPAVEEAADLFKSASDDCVGAETSHVNAVKDEKKKATQLDRIEAQLRAEVAKSVFKSIKTMRKARLDDDEVDESEALEQDLRKRSAEAGTLLKDSQREIGDLLKDNVMEGTAADKFQDAYGELKIEQEALIEENAELAKTIRDDAKNRHKREKGMLQLQSLQKALRIWNLLRELIGSADGKKFRTFAQAITLETLVRHANHHLYHLNPRYSICRCDIDPTSLALQIEDHHQADTRRAMNSLSGGESFLASLALALGLSDLTGRAVAIDTLFIDEGFGSLDANSLDIAIESLDRLRQSDKTIGVISHVELLKERITTQIVVQKKGDGTGIVKIIPEVTSSSSH
ncbi:AAA family ATPase [bacterium]|nr:AAA family ATPase [bacterium]